MDNLKERIENSTTTVFKVVFSNMTNHYDTMFGGIAMEMMDEIAFITATRFCRKVCVTVSSDKIDFKKPIPEGSIVEIQGKIEEVGRTSLKVKVDIFREAMYSQDREKAIEGSFTFVALDENKKPTDVI